MRMTGLLLIVLGGVMEGLFALPMKFTPRWSWENIWAAGSLAALTLVPLPLVLLTVPHIGSIYASAPPSAIVLAVLFGAGWGWGGVFFGLGVSTLGLSMGTSLIMGLIAIGGSLIPMLLQHGDQLMTGGGAALLIGIGIMFVGLAICARAGSLRGGNRKPACSSRSPFALGIFYCAAAGLLSALVNLALIFGEPIAKPALSRGLDLSTANNTVWALVFTSNYLVNLGFCIFKSVREKTLHKFFLPSTAWYWLLAVVMGILWAGGIVIYGRGASMEGVYGPIFGFPIMLAVSILTGNLVGAVGGEWRGSPARARYTMTFGLSIMLLAIATLGYGTYLIR
jgi:L-rhamnose-H+ transport protein